MKFSKLIEESRNYFFNQVHQNNLIYNTCWEDPAVDRAVLNIQKESEIVMLTSAGDNALAYLLDQPKNINCVDVNRKQNALLELKIACYKRGDYENLSNLFFEGYHQNAKAIYYQFLREYLDEDAKLFWDEKIKWFCNPKKSFYFYSTSGYFAKMFNRYLKWKGFSKKWLEELNNCSNPEKQLKMFEEFSKKIFNKLTQWVLNRQMILNLLGVPDAQKQLIFEKFENGMNDYIYESLEKVFTQSPFSKNYFYKIYLNGKYDHMSHPEYLSPHHFNTIEKQVNKINTYHGTLSHFLQQNPGQYSHFILLDHQDWLAQNSLEALIKEWKEILKNEKPEAKILIRSASNTLHFIPKFVSNKIDFQNINELNNIPPDRVATYAGNWIGTVR